MLDLFVCLFITSTTTTRGIFRESKQSEADKNTGFPCVSLRGLRPQLFIFLRNEKTFSSTFRQSLSMRKVAQLRNRNECLADTGMEG